MKRLIFVGVSLFLASGAFAQAEKFADIVDVYANAAMNSTPGILSDGRVYEIGFTVDYSEKSDLTFGFTGNDDPCPKRGVCAYTFEQAYDPNFADGDFSSFESNETILKQGTYRMRAPNSADVTFPSLLLGEEINARFTRTGPVNHNTFTNQIVPPDGAGFIEIAVDGSRSADAFVELTGMSSGTTHTSNGFLAKGHFRALNTVLPNN